MSAAAFAFVRQARVGAGDPGPFYVLPMMPALLMTVVFTALFDRIANVDGFDGTDYDSFLIPGVVVLVALLGGGATSASLAGDLRSGYLDRLRLLPINVRSQLTGRVVFEAVRLVPATIVVLIVGFAFGADANNGVTGVAVVAVLVVLLGVAHSSVFYLVAIATADPQTPFTLQPLGLPLAFLSTALVPVAAMPGWAATIARANPVSFVVDGAREAMLGDLWSQQLVAALGVLVVWIGLGQALAGIALTRKLERS